MGLLKRQTIMGGTGSINGGGVIPTGSLPGFGNNSITSFGQPSMRPQGRIGGGLFKAGSYSTMISGDEAVPETRSEKAPEGVMELEDATAIGSIEGEAPAAPEPAPPAAPQIDRLLIEEAEKKASEIVKKARAEAKKLIEETKLYSQSAFSQAETDGFNKGKEEGFEAGKEEMANLILEAKDVLNQVLKERELLLRSIEPEMAKLSVRIAEKIMRYQIDIDQDAVVNMIRAALEAIKQREEVIIKVNQEDYYYAKEKKSVFSSMVEGLKTMDIVVDSSVDRGGCIIETNLGNVDARISTQIHTLELVFDKVAEQREADYNEEA